MTSLELPQYRDWLEQRRRLARPGTFFWTWVQTHLQDWFLNLAYPDADHGHFDEPIGPQGEQVRLLTYLALSAGCRGLGFWSDRFLADSHQGRDRLLTLEFERVQGGTRFKLAEFDMTAAVVFTSDIEQLARWQNQSRQMVKVAAQWSHDLASVEIAKVERVQAQLAQLAQAQAAPAVPGAAQLLARARQYRDDAKADWDKGDYRAAYHDGQRALRPL